MKDTAREALRGWLSLLRTANQVKKQIDGQLRAEFGQSISRFDALSALHRANRNGVRAGELSRQMYVSEGNITQLMAKLMRDDLVLRRRDPADARAVIYSLSDEGLTLFERMADVHRDWVRQLFSELDAKDLQQLTELLKRLPSETNIQEVA